MASDADAIMLKIILGFLPIFNLICQYFRKKQSQQADHYRGIRRIYSMQFMESHRLWRRMFNARRSFEQQRRQRFRRFFFQAVMLNHRISINRNCWIKPRSVDVWDDVPLWNDSGWMANIRQDFFL